MSDELSDSPLEKTSVRDPMIGATLGDYRVVRSLGNGGMGVVYEGVHTTIHKKVAIKVVRPDLAQDPALRKRIVSEAQASNAIRHRNIVDVHAHGLTPDGRPYLVMEYLDGSPLDALLDERGSFPWPEGVSLVLELCAPLAAAHRAGVVHRDLKPSNVYWCTDEEGGRFLKLLDFGLAKQTQSKTASTLTSSAIVMGTPDYMAPEQARAQGTEPRTDVYALGCLTYELLTGRLPYSAPSAVDVLMQHCSAPIPRLRDALPDAPEALDELVAKMMAKELTERPTIEQVREGLRQLLGRAPHVSVPQLQPVPRASPAHAPTLSPQTPAAGLAPVAATTEAKQAPVEPSAAPAPTQRPRALVGVAVAVVCVGAVGWWLMARQSDAPAPTPAPPLPTLKPLEPVPVPTPPTPPQVDPEPTQPPDPTPTPVPPPVENPTIAPAPPVEPQPTTAKRPKRKIPTVDELLARIDKLEAKLAADPSAVTLLKRYRGDAERAAADAEREALSTRLDSFQKTYGLR